MAKVGAAGFAVLLVDGFDLLAAKPKGFSHKTESMTEPSNGLGDSNVSNTPVGMRQVTLTQDGAFFEDATNGMHAALKASQAVLRVVSYALTGNAIGARFEGIEGAYLSSYEVLNTIGALTKANAVYTVAGQLDDGVIVQHQTPKTADWNTKTLSTVVDYTLDTSQRVIPITSSSVANPSLITTPIPHGKVTGDSIIPSGHAGSTPTLNGGTYNVTVVSPTSFTIPVNVTVGGTGGSFIAADSSNGAVGYQQISDLSGFTGFIGKIRHSTNDTTYFDLITFANVTTARAAERKTVAGVINRYLSYDGDVTGSGTLTPFVGLARL